jgi:hypothetical protein
MKKVLAVVVCILTIPVVGEADLVIEEKIETSGFMGMWSSQGTEITYIKGDKIRNESRVKAKGMMQGMMADESEPTVSIIRLDKGIMWFIDDTEGTYHELPLKGEESAAKREGVDVGVKDLKVTETGEKKEIVGYECEGVNVEMTFETTAEGETISQTAETLLWMASKAKGLDEMRNLWERMLDVAQTTQQGFPVRDALEEVWKKMEETGGIPLGMEITMAGPMGMTEEDDEMKEAVKMAQKYLMNLTGETEAVGEESTAEEESPSGQMKIIREVISIEEKALDDALFEVPESYRKNQGHPMMFNQPGGQP